MTYPVRLSVDAYHVPSETWMPTYTGTWHVRAVSRRHAIRKGLKIAWALPCYSDRDDDPDWQVTAEVKLLDDPE